MTMSAIFAGHSPPIRDYASAPPTPPAPPAPPTPPSPPQSEPITFGAVTRSDVYAEIGSALGSTTLATITCADSGMTIVLSETVAGLTFSYSAGVLTVAGTPTGSTRVQRVVVSYISSDGNTTVRGSTTHTFTLVKAAETLTIGTIAGITGRVGTPLSATVCTPTANFDADVQCFGATALGGVTVVWEWNRAGRTGTLTLTGTPTQSFNGGFSFSFSANGQTLGTGVSNCTIVQSYQAPAPAPAPTPSPPAPSPSPPPAPTPAPAPGLGSDPYFAQTKVLLHFDAADSGLNSATSQPAFSAVACSQATNSGLGLMQRFGYDTATEAWSMTAAASSVMQAQVSGLDGSASDVSVECLIQPATVFWDAMYATSADETRFSPLVTYINPQTGDVIWSLGIGSAVNNLGRYAVVTFVVPISGPQSYAIGYSTTMAAISLEFGYNGPGAYNNRLVHVAGSFGARIANGDVSIGAWLDWTGGLYSQRMNAGGIKALANGVVQIGGTVRQLDYVFWWRKPTTIIPFAGSMDEVRVTLGRYSSRFVDATVSNIPADRRTLPWANY